MITTFDPATGLPVELLDYAPDVSVYDDIAEADGPPAWLDEIDTRAGDPFVHMSTRATPFDTWLQADAARPMELALKQRLIDERRDAVFACLPTADQAAAELLGEVVHWLDSHGIAHEQTDPAEHPLLAAGRIVQEDLCLMIDRDGAWHFDGAVLCFPTLWLLADRIGKSTPNVHERVPHYDAVTDKVDRFFDRLPVGKVVWRRNLSIKPYPYLHLATAKTELPRDGHAVAADGAPYWLRTERQTLHRMPGTGAIVFAIRVQLARAGVLRERPDVAAALATMYRSWDEPMRGFKFAGSDLSASFVDWLETIAE